MDNDFYYIQETLKLAEQGLGRVSPNPMVGSVIVKDGQIVGSGFHSYATQLHAEIIALDQAGEKTKGATLYTNLEPCCHHGRTPPCTDSIIKSGIIRVVSSISDPNPHVSGAGFARLRAAGIEVSIGIAEKESLSLNEIFVTYFTKHRPFIHLKMATSLDGRIATRTGDSKWITGKESVHLTQELRYQYDAILVGIGTALIDNPELTYRENKSRHRPLYRILLDSTLKISIDSYLVQTASKFPTWIFTSNIDEDKKSRIEKKKNLETFGVKIIPIQLKSSKSDFHNLDLNEVLTFLANEQITSVLVEGGAEVAASFLTDCLVDKVTFNIAPILIGGRSAPCSIGGEGHDLLSDAVKLADVSVNKIGEDISITGYPIYKLE